MTAPLWGIIIDKFMCNKSIIFFGSAATAVSMLLIGPSPFLNAEKYAISCKWFKKLSRRFG